MNPGKSKILWKSTWVESPLAILTRRQDRIEEILKDTSIHCTESEIIAYREEMNTLEAERRKILFENTNK